MTAHAERATQQLCFYTPERVRQPGRTVDKVQHLQQQPRIIRVPGERYHHTRRPSRDNRIMIRAAT